MADSEKSPTFPPLKKFFSQGEILENNISQFHG